MEINELFKSIILKKDSRFKIILDNIISSIKDNIWNDTLLQHYTKHGIDHSSRIVKNLGKLLEDFPTLSLNELERFILLAAIFLHDIGMQLPEYADLPIKSEYSMDECEIIRENHHLASYKAIMDSIKPNAKFSLGLERCKEYANYIASLCKYHRELKITDLKDTSIAGNQLKLNLLGALLRLGDELDTDYQRVDMKILNRKDIPTESKFYWWSHYYVKSVSIEKGHIKLLFWFPDEYKNNSIIEDFQKKRIGSLKEQFLEVYDILYDHNIRLHYKIGIEDIEYLSAGSLKLVSSDLLGYIKKKINKPDINYKKLSDTQRAVWEIGEVLYSDNEKVREALAKISQLMNEYKYKEAVKIIEETSLLTMSPTDRMIFSGIAGNCYLALSELDEAENYYNKQLELSKSEDLRAIYQPNIIDAYSAASTGNLGIVYHIKDKPGQALQYQKKALVIAQDIDNKKSEANSLCNLGIIYGEQGDFEKSIEYFNSARTIHQEIGIRKGEASYLGNMGIVYKMKSDRYLKKSLEHFQQALNINRETDNKQWEASALDEMGIVYRIQGYPKKALEFHQQALKIHCKIGNKEGEAKALTNMGDVYNLQSKLKKALKYFKKSLKIFEDMGIPKNIENIIKKIMIIEEEINNGN